MHTTIETSPPLTPMSIAYPAALMELFQARFGMVAGHSGIVIGDGSKRLAELFTWHNQPISFFDGDPAGTDLPTGSVDFIAADRILFSSKQQEIREEFRRILKPGGPVAIVTDNRVYSGSEQQEAYETMLRTHCRDFREKRLPYDIAGAVTTFFRGGRVFEDAFIGQQSFTEEDFLAQAESLTIYPALGDSQWPVLEQALHRFFQLWASPQSGLLQIPTLCRVAYGHLGN